MPLKLAEKFRDCFAKMKLLSANKPLPANLAEAHKDMKRSEMKSVSVGRPDLVDPLERAV